SLIPHPSSLIPHPFPLPPVPERANLAPDAPTRERAMRRHHALSRRQFFEAAGCAGLGLLPGPVAVGRPADPRPRPLRACILLFYYGGPSHLDTLDPKP